MKSRLNPFALLLRLALVVEIVLGSTIYFPAVALAGAPGARSPAPAPQSGSAPDVGLCEETAFYCLSVQQ